MKKMYLFLLLCTAFVATAQGYQVGDKATDFKLKNIDKQSVSLAHYKEAKGFIVVFTCNHCPYAIAYEDRIIALNNEFAPKGYPVIAINPNDPVAQPADNFEEMQVRAKEKGFTFPYLVDEGQTIYPQYGATRTPHVYVLQKDKKDLIVRYIGAIDDNHEGESEVKTTYVRDAVNALLKNKPVPVAQTKAIGCTIKVKK